MIKRHHDPCWHLVSHVPKHLKRKIAAIYKNEKPEHWKLTIYLEMDTDSHTYRIFALDPTRTACLAFDALPP